MHARLAFGILLVLGLADLAWLDLHLAPQYKLTQAGGPPGPVVTGPTTPPMVPSAVSAVVPASATPPVSATAPVSAAPPASAAPPVSAVAPAASSVIAVVTPPPTPPPPEATPVVGETLVDVPFDLDSYQVNYLPSLVILRQLAAQLASDPSKHLRVRGHSDQMGSTAHKVRLSRSRAMAVQAYLITHGAPAAQISIEAIGASEPIDAGNNPIAWAKNRRVQVVWR